MNDVAKILSDLENGNLTAADKLLPLVYEELRRLAAIHLQQESAGQTLQATALVHEAYLRLLGPDSEPGQWQNRRHFFGAISEAMRRILIENARRKHRLKHGGSFDRQPLDDFPVFDAEVQEDLLALDAALQKLNDRDPEAAELVRLRYFAGLTMSQVAAAMEVSERTAARIWNYARVWLLREMGGGESA